MQDEAFHRKKIRIADQTMPEKKVDQATSLQLARSLERHCIKLLVREPEWLQLLDRVLQKVGLNRLDIADFDHADFQIFVRIIMQSLEQDLLEPEIFLKANIPENLQIVLNTLQSEPLESEIRLDQKLQEDLIRSVLKLRLVRVNEGLQQMRYLLEELKEQGDSGINPYQDMILRYTLLRGRLDQALGRPIQLD